MRFLDVIPVLLHLIPVNFRCIKLSLDANPVILDPIAILILFQ